MDEIKKERLMISITTLAGISCIFQNYFGGWEFWVPVIVFIGAVFLWWLHITQRLTVFVRIIFYYAYAAFLLFYHGIHKDGLYDVSVSAALFLATFTMADGVFLLNLILSEYVVVMAIQIYFLYTDGNIDLSAFNIMKIVFHFGTVITMYIFARITVKSRIIERIRLTKWKDSVAQNDRDMEDFLTNISHELRTPVNVISGMTTILQKEIDSDELSSIQEAGIRLAHHIEDIQDYTEIKRGELVLEEENYICTSLINDVVTNFRSKFDNSDVELVIDLDPKTPYMLNGDIKKIHKIFRHLVDNAIKFTGKGSVEVKVFPEHLEDGTNLVIEVTDTGIGMTRADLSRVSKGMYQANKKRNRSTGGIGIGLTIVYGFAHKMGGFVMMSSEVGRGTTVRVALPQTVINPEPCMSVEDANKEWFGQSTEEQKFEEKVRFEGVKALVVDDEPMNLVVAAGLLKEYGIKVDTADRGIEAIEKYENGDYDVIFMDHMMPGMDGVEAMRRIRQVASGSGRNPVLIALTANALSGAREMFIKEGFDGFIAKPIDISLFERVMKRVLPDDMIQYEGRGVK